MRLSLRELLTLVTFVGFTLAGVMFGPPISWIALSLTVILLNLIAIDAFVAPPRQRSFAIGFMLPCLIYLCVTIAIGRTEYSAQLGTLPTTQFLQSVLKPSYTFGVSSSSDSELRQINAFSVIPLGQLCFACVFGDLGGWYARWSSRSTTDK